MRKQASAGVALAALVGVATAHAETEIIERDGDRVVVESEVEYAMGEGESMEDAREGAREKAQQNATDMVGSWVRSESLVEEGTLQETTVRTLTATRLSGEVEDDEVTVVDGVPHLRLTYRATLDTSGLEDWTEALADREELRSDIELLERRNTRLLDELAEIEEQVAAGEASADTIERRRKLVERMDRNRNRVSVTFDESLAEKEEREAETYSEIRERIDDYFWKALADGTRVEILDVRTEPYRKPGDRFDRDKTKVRIFYKLTYTDQFRKALEWLQRHTHMDMGTLDGHFASRDDTMATVRPSVTMADARRREKAQEMFDLGDEDEDLTERARRAAEEAREEAREETAANEVAAEVEQRITAFNEEHGYATNEENGGAPASAGGETTEPTTQEPSDDEPESEPSRASLEMDTNSTDLDKPHAGEIAERLAAGRLVIVFQEESTGYSKRKRVEIVDHPAVIGSDMGFNSTEGRDEMRENPHETAFLAPGRYETYLLVDKGAEASIEAIHAMPVAGLSNGEEDYPADWQEQITE